MVICLERGADLHITQLMTLPLTVSCSSKIQIGFTFLVPAHPGRPGQRAVKRVCVCVFVLYSKINFYIRVAVLFGNQPVKEVWKLVYICWRYDPKVKCRVVFWDTTYVVIISVCQLTHTSPYFLSIYRYIDWHKQWDNGHRWMIKAAILLP